MFHALSFRENSLGIQEKDVSEVDVFTELVVNFIYYIACLTFDVVWDL